MNLNKIINHKIYWVYLVSFFLIVALSILVLPLYFLFIPFTWAKTIVFRIILSVLIFFFLWQILSKDIKLSDIKSKINSVSFPFWLLISFFLISLLATISSQDVHFSLWGSPIRAGGFINLTFYIIFGLLTFLLIRKKDWQKLWNFTIMVAILVSLVAVFQKFGIFQEFLTPVHFRPSSTIGNPIFLAIYFLLLTFLCLSFTLKSENIKRKAFYFLSFLIFLFVSIFLTQTRAAFLGLITGFLWFLFAYPKKLTKTKIFSAIFLLLLILGASYLDSHFYLLGTQPEDIKSAIGRMLSIFTEPQKIAQSRISVWKVALAALKERPILGYGPENFEIAFDKYYDPSLPRIGPAAPGSETEWQQWWDRAHNFLFDISTTAGTPALIIYISFFIVLFWQLQKIKRKKPEAALISHGLQATFIGYLTANLFSFDYVDVYFILFLLIGYSFSLISSSGIAELDQNKENNKILLLSDKLYKQRKIIAVFVFLFLSWFVFVFNIKPLRINLELNSAYYLFGNKNYEEAFKITDRISSSRSIIDSYVRISIVDIIQEYNNYHANNPKISTLFTRKAVWLLQEDIKAQPNRLRGWLLTGESANFLIKQKMRLNNNFLNTEESLALKKEADYYFREASLLSPKRQEVYKEWAKTGLLTQDYDMAKEKAQKCIDLNNNYGICYWLMAIMNEYLKDEEQFNYYLNIAKEKNYDIESEKALEQLISMSIEKKHDKSLTDYYQELIAVIPEDKREDNRKARLYISLSILYKEMGEFEKAKEAALKVLDFQLENKEMINEFLETLK